MPDTGASRKRQIRGNRIRGHFIAPADSAAGNRRSHDSLQFNWSPDPDCQGRKRRDAIRSAASVILRGDLREAPADSPLRRRAIAPGTENRVPWPKNTDFSILSPRHRPG
jgi:hypothetical protein